MICSVCIYVQLLLKFERGTYAKRLGKVYQNEFKKLPPENILQFARAMPFVRDSEVRHTHTHPHTH